MTDLPTAITVYIPRDDSHLNALLAPGTGIVGSNAETWLQGRRDFAGDAPLVGAERQVLIDYEPLTAAANIVTFADRVYHAYDRHVRHFPTHKRMVADADQLWPVAYYWSPEGRVQISGSGAGLVEVLPDGQALYKLADWLGFNPEGDLWRPDGGESSRLVTELRATHRAVSA